MPSDVEPPTDGGTSPKVVIAIDPTKHPLDPLRLGGELARQMQLPVVLVTVFPHHPLLEGREDERQRTVRADARGDLLELGRSLDGVEVDDALVLASSSPARALYESSESANAAIIVVGSTTRGALRRVLAGSVAQQLLSGAACPVAVAPYGYDEQEGRDVATVGVAFDGSEESERALAGARGLAQRAAARLRIITVHQRLAFGGVPVSAIQPAGTANQIAKQQLRDAYDAALAADEDVPRVEGVFREGDPAAVLLEQSHEVDLLIARRPVATLHGPLPLGPRARVSRGTRRSPRRPVRVLRDP